MSKVDLPLIAEKRVNDPLNSWPEHRRDHLSSGLGNLVFDRECLRCWLEAVATEKYTRKGRKHDTAS